MQMILNFSFHPHNFDSNIAHLQNALQDLGDLLLDVRKSSYSEQYSSKTEFLIICLKTQLSKTHNSSSLIKPLTHSASNLGIISRPY